MSHHMLMWPGTSFEIWSENNPWDPEAIATSLSRLNRFTGNTRWPYSVAQHSCLCVRLLLRDHADNNAGLALACLLHDAHESIAADVPGPVLAHCRRPDGDPREHLIALIDLWIATRVGISMRMLRCGVVQKCDLLVRAAEFRDLFLPGHGLMLPEAPADFPVEPWHPEYAKDKWLSMYHEWRERLNDERD